MRSRVLARKLSPVSAGPGLLVVLLVPADCATRGMAFALVLAFGPLVTIGPHDNGCLGGLRDGRL